MNRLKKPFRFKGWGDKIEQPFSYDDLVRELLELQKGNEEEQKKTILIYRAWVKMRGRW